MQINLTIDVGDENAIPELYHRLLMTANVLRNMAGEGMPLPPAFMIGPAVTATVKETPPIFRN